MHKVVFLNGEKPLSPFHILASYYSKKECDEAREDLHGGTFQDTTCIPTLRFELSVIGSKVEPGVKIHLKRGAVRFLMEKGE